MAQNTTSSAYSQLQPNKSNNIGNIVQENIRYWRKYEDEKTAREKIQKAREAEFKYKQDQNADALFEALRPDDPIGVFNSKLAEAFEKNQDKLLDLSIKASKGDTSAKIQYQKELTKWSNLASAGSAFQNKIKANAEARKNGLYNPILDESFINFEKSLVNGALTFNPDTLETTITSADGTDIVLPASKITSNEFFTHQYSPPAKFQEYGTALTESIYGQNPNISNEDAMLKGRKQVRDIFATDPIERDTWYGTYLKRQGINPRGQKPYDKLPLKKKIAIEDAYIAENVQRPVKTTKDKLEETRLTGARLSNQKSRLDISKKEKELELLNNPPPEDDEDQEEPKFRIEAKAGQTGRLARTTNINGDDATVFESFKSFKVKTGVDKRDEDVFIEIDSVVLSDEGDISYRDSEGKEGVNPDIIDEIVRKLKFKDRKDLFDEMKANRDYKLSKLGNNTSTTTINQPSGFDPTKF